MRNSDRPEATQIVGIVNVTPDSFSGDGIPEQPDLAAQLAVRLVSEGADIVDVGGQSTRPGSTRIPEREEARRVLPAIEKIAAAVDVPLSVDTARAAMADAALKAGARIVNDVSGLSDPEVATVAARHAAGLILVHNGPVDRTQPIESVRSGLASLIERSLAAGVRGEKLIVDPGLGFGKDWRANLLILRDLRRLTELGFPILVGPSRKGTIGRVLGVGVNDRLEGTIALVTIAIANGASLVRVHDVKAVSRAARVADAIRSAR